MSVRARARAWRRINGKGRRKERAEREKERELLQQGRLSSWCGRVVLSQLLRVIALVCVRVCVRACVCVYVCVCVSYLFYSLINKWK